MNSFYRIHEFAALAGVTVRTLHHYDRLELLRPRRTHSRYRLYSESDLERLEKIIALKFIGIPLKQIKTLLDRDGRGLAEVLRSQRRALEEKRRLLDQAIAAVRDGERAVRPGGQTGTAVLKKIIEVIEMQNDVEFWKKYYSEDAWNKLGQKRTEWTPELQKQAEKAWSDLFREVEAALGEDPASSKAQQLAVRWQKLLESFTGGDPDISAGAGRVWADRQNWPAHLQQKSERFTNPRIWEFMTKAMKCSKRQG